MTQVSWLIVCAVVGAALSAGVVVAWVRDNARYDTRLETLEAQAQWEKRGRDAGLLARAKTKVPDVSALVVPVAKVVDPVVVKVAAKVAAPGDGKHRSAVRNDYPDDVPHTRKHRAT